MLPLNTTRTLSLLAIFATAALAACSKTADAPPPAADPPASQNVRSFAIGDLSALSLRDGAMELPNDNKVFGDSGYLITSGAESLLYVGDSMHHFVVSVQKPEWTIAFDGDSPTASRSRADLIAASAASGQRIYAVHFPFPGVGKFEKQGDGFVWVAE